MCQYDAGHIIMVCADHIPPVFTSAGRTVFVNLVVSRPSISPPPRFGFSLTYKIACMPPTHSLSYLLAQHQHGGIDVICCCFLFSYFQTISIREFWICWSHRHRDPFNGPLSRTTRVSRYQKGKTSLDFTEARDSEWQCHQLGRMQVCTLLQTDNHAYTHHSVFYRPDVFPAAQPPASKH